VSFDDETPAPRPRRAALAWIIVLAVALLASIAGLAFFVVQYLGARDRLADADATIEQQRQQIEEQQKAVDQKETFKRTAQSLMDAAHGFEGLPFAELLPFDRYRTDIERGWAARWNPAAMDRVIADVQADVDALHALAADAQAQASTNASGTAAEATIDELGHGYVTSVYDDTATLCGRADALGCVISDDPLTVHFDAAANAEPYMTDWIRTGVAYHEFAHVLQFLNPEPTDTALAAFGGDLETMADCFALTYLDGWSLQQRVWIDATSYWDLDIGYGLTCDEGQRQVVRDWYDSLALTVDPIAQ